MRRPLSLSLIPFLFIILGLLGMVPSAGLAMDFSFFTIDVPGGVDTKPLGINNSGQIVGFFVSDVADPSAPQYGFLKDGNNYITIRVPGSTFTHAFGINDRGQIVGTYGDATGNTVLWPHLCRIIRE